jgi:uncharacterized protein (DUF433 family)
MEQSITTDPDVLLGKPVVAGTRITVEHILQGLGAGETVEDLLEAHPRLTLKGIQAALSYAASVMRNDAVSATAGSGTMTKISFEEIEDAFDFVSFAEESENGAVLCRRTGKFFYCSELCEIDGIDGFPEDVDENPDYVAIPHKNELDLGRRLVSDFTSLRFPEGCSEVDRIFGRRGAYGRFKALLQEHGLLDDWFEYESMRCKTALREWCEANDIEIEDRPAP